MQQEFTIGKAYYLYLDTTYCDNWLSGKNEKWKEKRDANWTILALAFNSAWDFELQYVEPPLNRGVSKRGVGTVGGVGVYLFAEQCFLRDRVRVKGTS